MIEPLVILAFSFSFSNYNDRADDVNCNSSRRILSSFSFLIDFSDKILLNVTRQSTLHESIEIIP